MKLIIKEYLANLKERNELDAMLPNLLSAMGLNVYARPIRGANEYGVDIAAVGKIDGGVEKVYLLSVKSGNLTRSMWQSNSTDQALRPSLESILDSYIPHRLPPEHKSKPIVICMCFGGDIQTTARQEVSGFTQRNTTKKIKFEEWNGDKISDFILDYLFNEDLLHKEWKSYLRKSIALLDEPEASHRHFKKLVATIIDFDSNKLDENHIIQIINRVNLCLWIIYSWGRESKNLESTYMSAEYCILIIWDIIKKKLSTKIIKNYDTLTESYVTITGDYVNRCLSPFTGKKHLLSRAINTRCSIDLNIKLFELLGKLSVYGEWLLFKLKKTYEQKKPVNEESIEQKELRKLIDINSKNIKDFILNNPLLLSPFKDEHAIEIAITSHVLLQNSEHDEFMFSWLNEVSNRIMWAYKFCMPNIYMHPTMLNSYEEILNYKDSDTPKQDNKLVTKGSILYPLLMVLTESYNMEETREDLIDFCNKELEHCTLQYWFPNNSSETYYYNNLEAHGSAFTDIKDSGFFSINKINDVNNHYPLEKLSAISNNYAPLIFVSSRYYRTPLPIQLLLPSLNDIIQR